MINGLSYQPSVGLRHSNAPLLKEREQFLRHIAALSRTSIRMTSAYLIHIVRIMALNELRKITNEDIEEAGRVSAEREKHFLRTERALARNVTA